MGHYDRLTALDSSFLELEDENTHMHVAVTMLFEPGPLATPTGGIDMEKVRAYVEARLHDIPRYRQRLSYVPLEGRPVWVDDERFNLFYHVRHTCLPKPGSRRQLKRLCGRLLSQKLDRTKPLWELWLIEGLECGHFALVAKVHHCMVDGAAGADLLAALLSPTPDTSVPESRGWIPRKAPSELELVGGEAWRRLTGVGSALSSLPGALRRSGSVLREARVNAEAFGTTLSHALVPASDTPLNAEIGPHRRFDWLRFDLGDVRQVKDALGATVNDVVLATVTGAVRRFLERRGMPLRRDLDFRAMIPVNVRRSDDAALGNHVSQVVAHLPVEEEDPVRRLTLVHEKMNELKASHQIEATELVEELSDWVAPSILGTLARMAATKRAFNMVVTNVPGPQLPLYLLGAPLQEVYPTVPLFLNQALGIALFSYDGSLFWGLNADWDEVPDLHAFVEVLNEAFDELIEASRPQTQASASAQA